MEKLFKISAREVKQDNKQSFIACSTKIGDKFFKIKFTKECLTQPKKRGLYDLTVDIDKCSIQRGEKYVNKQGFEAEGQPTIWVREVVNLRPYTEEELNALNRAKFDAVFAEAESDNYEPLPF